MKNTKRQTLMLYPDVNWRQNDERERESKKRERGESPKVNGARYKLTLCHLLCKSCGELKVFPGFKK